MQLLLLKSRIFLVWTLICLGVVDLFSLEVGIDTNAPISAVSGDIAAPCQVVAETGTDWVRVNFILGPWDDPHDVTPHGSGNLTWLQTYEQIVDGFVDRGVNVYGLIGAEAVHSSAPGINNEQYVQDYKANFVEIVDHFKDRIRVFESFNEPNDWAGGSTAQLQPYWFARILEQIYLGVKYEDNHTSDSEWQVSLVSGPLFSHDLDNVASYLQSVITAGTEELGWEDVKTLTGSYPLDGLGYHIYVKQGSSSAQEIRDKMKSNLDAVWNVFTTLEGADTDKKIWVSEVGWTTEYVTEQVQADNLDTVFDFFRTDGRIRLGVWFCLKDFPNGHYGIFRESGLSESDKKPSWRRFFAQTVPVFESLQNSGFETGDLEAWEGFGELDAVQNGPWFAGIEPFEGAYFYGAAANWGSKNGVLFQRVQVVPGSFARAFAMIRTYRVGGEALDTACRIGIDPSGRIDPQEDSVIWCEWTESPHDWAPIQVEGILPGGIATIFLEYRQQAPEWNITAFDSVQLICPAAMFLLY